MRVTATAPGFYGQLRQIGDEFDVPEDAKATWFKPAKGEEPESKPARGRKPAGGEPADDLV